MDNFCRVFELPLSYPNGYCFGGGLPVVMMMVDWFYPIPQSEWHNRKPWAEYIPLLRDFLKDKVYVKPGRQYLLVTDFGECMMVTKEEA